MDDTCNQTLNSLRKIIKITCRPMLRFKDFMYDITFDSESITFEILLLGPPGLTLIEIMNNGS